MFWTNYHSHTHYCDGKEAPENYIKNAIQSGLKAYGFSSHSPVPFESKWNMAADELDDYIKEIISLKEKYKSDIEIYLSLEMDYIPGLVGPGHYKDLYQDFDYTLCSIHYVDSFADGRPWEIDGTHEVFKRGVNEIFEGSTQAAVKRYYELTRQMVEEEKPNIVGHLDKIKMQAKHETMFDENDKWYQDAIRETLQVIKSAGSIVEVNTRGWYQKKTREMYPGLSTLKLMRSMDIPVTISSDAHQVSEITLGFRLAAETLLEAGYQEVHSLLDNKWQILKLHPDGFIR